MSFTQFKLDKSVDQARGIFNKYIYETGDTMAVVQSAGYFSASRFSNIDNENTNSMGWIGGVIDCKCSDGYFLGEIQDDGSTIIEIGSDEKIARPTSEYNQTASDDIIIGTGNFNINLISLGEAKKPITIRSDGDSTLTLVADGADLIEAGSTPVTPNTSITLVPHGTIWLRI